MLFDKFIEETKKWWTSYFNLIRHEHSKGNINTEGNKILYPNILLVTNCSGFYVAEFIGATEKFNGLTLKKHEDLSIYRYLSQFDDSTPDPILCLDSERHILSGLCLAHEADFEALKDRFPHIELFGSKLNRIGGHGSTISFGSNFESCLIENSLLVNRSESIFRCKNVLSASIVKSGITKKKLIDLFEFATSNNQVKGVHVTSAHGQRLVIGAHLQSLALSQNLRETTIGEFIKLHPEIVKSAFKSEHFEYEPYLKWLEHDGTCSDTAINPDLLVKRSDGYYDIYDLKTALLNKKNITKASRSRRRFIDYVEEGISQLANYREYFEYPKNSRHAKEKYDIEVNNPKLVLVVGNFENVQIDEITQACRKYKDVQVIDYDTLCHMFIGAR